MSTTQPMQLPQLLAPLNRLIEPLLKVGIANPLVFTTGATVLEVPGRKSGVVRSVPLVCYLAGNLLIVGTVRRNSQWIRNLKASDEARIWLWGASREVSKLHVTDQVAVLQLR